jgi:adenylate cyclase
LIDAESGKHIWAEKYDRQLEDVFVVQDEITQNVVATIEPHLYEEESLRVGNQPPESVATWGLVVRALTLINKVDRAENQKAQALLDLAIAREPSYARAYAILAWAKWWDGYNRPGWDSAIFRKAEELAERALALDPNEPWALMTLGLTLSGSGHHDRALVPFHSDGEPLQPLQDRQALRGDEEFDASSNATPARPGDPATARRSITAISPRR